MADELCNTLASRPFVFGLNADAMLKAAGLSEVGDNMSPSSSGVLAEKHSAAAGIVSGTGGLTGVRHHASESILGDMTDDLTPSVAGQGVALLKEAIAVARYRADLTDMECPAFCSFVLPNGDLLEPQQNASRMKRALAAMPLQPQPAPHLQQAQAAMQQFLPAPPQMPQPQQPQPLPQQSAGMPAIAPGHQTLTGVPQRPIGLDQPSDTRATPLPGTPGHAATNVIDQQGGLDPRGLTVDGNNAAGIKKLGGDAGLQDAYRQIMAQPGANWFTAGIYNPRTVVGQLNLAARLAGVKHAAVDRSTQNDLHGRAVDQSTRVAVDQSTRPSVDQSTRQVTDGSNAAAGTKQASIMDRLNLRVATATGVAASLAGNAWLAHRLHSAMENLPKGKVKPDRIQALLAAAKLPANMPVIADKGSDNATYYNPADLEFADPKYQEPNSQHGAILYDPKFSKPGILAHEMGHASIRNAPWYSPSRFNQSWLRPLSAFVGNAAPVAGAIAGMYSNNPLIGAGVGAGAGLLLNAPTLINEYQASHRAGKYLQDANEDQTVQAANKATLSKAFHTYLGHALIPAVTAGGVGGLLGSSKQAEDGFKVAAWFDTRQRKRPKQPGSFPTLAAGLGLGAAGAYGLSQGLASDQQISRVRNAVSNYRPEAFQGKPPPNQTGLTHYQNTLSPAAQLTPFGMPIGKALVGVRSDPQLMEAMGNKSYALSTPAEQNGVNGMAHYNSFAGGPLPAYAHQLNAKLSDLPVPETLGVPAGTRYSDWMGRKLNDFVATQTGQRINPFEVTPEFMPHEAQSGLMERFHASLPPAEQAFRLKAEDPGADYAKQVDNYLPRATTFANTRDTLKNVGIAGGGAAAGALGGHLLYDGLTDDEDETSTGRTLASLAGAGLGGGAAYLGGTEHGRKLLGSGLAGLKNLVFGKSAAKKGWIGVDLDATLAKYDGWVSADHIGEPIQPMVDRVKQWLADGKDVRIFTARAADGNAAAIKTIQDWTEKHIGKRLEVTNVKDHSMTELWDDRAHRVAKNTGVKLSSDNRIAELQAQGHGRRTCLNCGAAQQCRCMRQHHDNLDIPDWTTPTCYDCEGGGAERRAAAMAIIERHSPQKKAADIQPHSTGRFITREELLNYGQQGNVDGQPQFATYDLLRRLSRPTSATLESTTPKPEKQASVAPFRPVNADPDFIAENQAWHDTEKANIAARRNRMNNDPMYREMVDSVMRTFGLK